MIYLYSAYMVCAVAFVAWTTIRRRQFEQRIKRAERGQGCGRCDYYGWRWSGATSDGNCIRVTCECQQSGEALAGRRGEQ